MRATGKAPEADLLEAEQLTRAIAEARDQHGATESQLQEIFSSEEERVDNAHALAEILLPTLTAALAEAPLARSDPAPQSARSGSAPSFGVPADSLPPAETQPTSPLLPGIADFIDEMLTQDRARPADRSSRRSA